MHMDTIWVFNGTCHKNTSPLELLQKGTLTNYTKIAQFYFVLGSRALLNFKLFTYAFFFASQKNSPNIKYTRFLKGKRTQSKNQQQQPAHTHTRQKEWEKEYLMIYRFKFPITLVDFPHELFLPKNEWNQSWVFSPELLLMNCHWNVMSTEWM